MIKPAGTSKSKLYCNRCGGFDLKKLKRTFISKHLFNEPRQLHCQSCGAKLSFQLIESNRPLPRPTLYYDTEDTVLSTDKLGRPVYVTVDEYIRSGCRGKKPSQKRWFSLWPGIFSGLTVFAIIISLFILAPNSKDGKIITKTKDVHVQPITRLGNVELLRLDNIKSKNANIELILLDEPKKAQAELVWEDIAERVERLSKQSSSGVRQPTKTIQRDLDRLLDN